MTPDSMSPGADEIPRGARRMFGVKDLFTTVNVLSGVVGIYYCIHQRPLAASFSFLVGYAGDAIDGTVARLTRSGNRFGAEYDAAADFVAQAVAPAFVVYTLYAGASDRLGISTRAADLLGIVLAAILVVVSSIRQARNAVRPVAIDFAWIGLPRNVASFLILGYTNSVLWTRVPGGLWWGVPLVLAIAWAELSPLPFMNHHGRRQLWWAKLGAIAFFTTTPIAAIFFTRYAWDLVFFWILGYSTLSWTAMSADERRLVREAVRAADAKLVADETARHHAKAKAQAR
ncbi:MAG TPA: CDP-alcohol phosphatidyltransferase family protein [Polyangia bacterium]|jgi:phosphatidylserine synthase|nr:CDP-alcohol phosphatidyltransferase family protein [Polyangia bacterium]